ncbi:uncharacterized protein VTP21DRAFT_7071 [Calcarisporiella thermophila]|uniref:uncharacterized protein n=1 Tax=Calcarisporiella thermophila TaxID=911321 RepID=UPI003743EC48
MLYSEDTALTSGMEEALRTAKLLEALRAGDTTALTQILDNPPPSTPKDISYSPSDSTHSKSTGSHKEPPSPLHLAVQCAAPSTISFLLTSPLRYYLDLNRQDLQGNTALHLAARLGRFEVVKLLMVQEGINDTIKNKENKEAIELARTLDIENVMNESRQIFMAEKMPLMHQFAREGNLEALKELFSHSRAGLLNINDQDPATGYTILHEAAARRNIEMVRFCISCGADVLIRDKKGKLARDLTKDSKIRAVLKDIPDIAIIQTLSPGEAPRLEGILNKWTNVIGGYKPRWFVLENGILSYYKNREDTQNACRGSINMLVARIGIDPTDKNRFIVVGKGSVQYHLRAGDPIEAKRWIFALTQSKQWMRDHVKAEGISTTGPHLGAGLLTGNRGMSRSSFSSFARPSLSFDDACSISSFHRRRSLTSDGATGNIAGEGGLTRSLTTASKSLVSTTGTEEMFISPTSECQSPFGGTDTAGENYEEEEEEEEINSPPHEETYPLTITSVHTQLEALEQLIRSLFINQGENASSGAQNDAQKTLHTALGSLRWLLDDAIHMAEERERFWRAKYELESERKDMWEQSLRDLMVEQQQMEQVILRAVEERKAWRAAMRQANGETNADLNKESKELKISTSESNGKEEERMEIAEKEFKENVKIPSDTLQSNNCEMSKKEEHVLEDNNALNISEVAPTEKAKDISMETTVNALAIHKPTDNTPILHADPIMKPHSDQVEPLEVKGAVGDQDEAHEIANSEPTGQKNIAENKVEDEGLGQDKEDKDIKEREKESISVIPSSKDDTQAIPNEETGLREIVDSEKVEEPSTVVLEPKLKSDTQAIPTEEAESREVVDSEKTEETSTTVLDSRLNSDTHSDIPYVTVTDTAKTERLENLDRSLAQRILKPTSDRYLKLLVESARGYPSNFRAQLPLDPDAPKPNISLFSILRNAIGKDLTRVSIPVIFNEPTSMLQRLCEDMEYSELLDRAVREKHSIERLMYVATFAMSNYASTSDRVVKPFNPLLGETFEYVREDKGYRYIAEQVSHHPPVSACFCESSNFNFFADTDVKSKFWGKSFEVMPQGLVHLQLKVPVKLIEPDTAKDPSENILEHYTWRKPTTCVHNLIVGKPWIDHYGEMSIVNHRTGEKATLNFKARGWRGRDAFEVRGTVQDKDGKGVWELAGRWNDKLVARRIREHANESDDEDQVQVPGSFGGGISLFGDAEDLLEKAEEEDATFVEEPYPETNEDAPLLLLWRKNPDSRIAFNLTPFAATLNELPATLRTFICPTDSRFRPDQRALEMGDFELASAEKHRLEEKQRAKRREREHQPPLLPPHVPRWFQRKFDYVTGEMGWFYTHEYWQERERCANERLSGTGLGRWDVIDDDIY